MQGNVAAPKTEPESCHHPRVNPQPFPSQQLQAELLSSFPAGDRGLCCRPSSGLNSACCGKAAESGSSVPKTVKLKSNQAGAFWKQLQFPFSKEQGSQILYYLSSSKPHDIYFPLHTVYITYINH